MQPWPPLLGLTPSQHQFTNQMVPELNGTVMDLDATFFALSDPTRRAILGRLQTGAASVADLAKPFPMGVRAISKHIAVLEQAGLVTKSSQAQKRLSRIEIGPLREIDRWLETYRDLWETRFDKMEELLLKPGKDIGS
jgi:DNA-binding transcriptional ArsR family regulator